MPVQIDRINTTVELTATAAPSAAPAAERPGAGAAPAAASGELRGLVGRLMAEELDRFLRNRGMAG